MPTKIAAIQGVSIKTTQRGDLYQVATTDGTEYATFNGGLANQARSLIGQTVALSYSEKQNGQYTNLYYEGAEISNGHSQPTLPIFGNQAAGGNGNPSSFPQQPQQTANPERELKIMRQTATKVAAQMLAFLPANEQTPMTMLSIADFLVDYYQHGSGPQTTPAPPAPAGQFIAADDIPF